MKPFALIIEDDPKLAKIFSEALSLSNFDAEIIHHGNIALKRLATVVPNLIVLDIHLPYLSGRDILEAIHANPDLEKTFVIIVTADLFEAEDLQGKADQVLMKPISFQRLHQVIEQLLTRPKAKH